MPKRVIGAPRKILQAICEFDAFSWNTSVFTASEISNVTGFSRYIVYKYLNFWKEKGFIEKGSEGIPAEYTYEGECIHENFPPRNGWRLTEKGYQSATYKSERKKAHKSFEEWANGVIEEE